MAVGDVALSKPFSAARFARTGVLCAALVAGAAVGPPAVRGAPQEEGLRALRCGALVDVAAGARIDGAVVVVEGERIASVGTTVPAGATVVDLSDATCLPGLIDAHSHILIGTDSYQIDHLRWSSATKALRGLAAAQANLRHGWTTLRIAGDSDVFYAHLDVGQAIEEGMFLGPRITGAGHYMSVTGGGGDLNQLGPEHHVVADGLVVDGPWEIQRAVREEIKYGSDWIKLLVTGAFMSTGDSPTHVQFSPEELRAAVEEAGRRGVPVMAHAHATDGIKMAIEAGVRSIEHGTFMDTEAMEMMIERDIWWVPTVYIGRYYLEAGTQTGDLDKMMELTRLYQEDSEQRLREGIRRGVKIAVGSDFGGYAQERNVREIETLVDLGMTPMQAIRAATLVGAELLGWEDRVGNLEAGKLADVIAVDGDPLDDIRALRDVRFVMVGGRVARSQPGPRRRPGGRGSGFRRGDLDGLPELDPSAATPRSRRSRGTDPAGRPCSITMPASISRLSRSCSAPTPSRPTTSRRRASSTGSSTTDGTGTVSTTATTSETSVPTATRLPGLRPWASTVPGATGDSWSWTSPGTSSASASTRRATASLRPTTPGTRAGCSSGGGAGGWRCSSTFSSGTRRTPGSIVPVVGKRKSSALM